MPRHSAPVVGQRQWPSRQQDTHRRKWMGEKYKKGEGRGEEGGGKREAIFLISSFVSFRRLTLRPPLHSLSLSLVPPPPPSSTPYGRQSRSEDDRPILLFRFICRSETLLFRIVARFNGLIYFARFSFANRLDLVDH